MVLLSGWLLLFVDMIMVVFVVWCLMLVVLVVIDDGVCCFGSLVWEYLMGLFYFLVMLDIDLLW